MIQNHDETYFCGGFALYIQKRPHLEPLCSRVWWFFKCSFPKKNWQCLDAPGSLGLLLYGLIDLFTLKIKLYLIRHQKYFKSKKGDSQNNKTNSISSPSQILWEIHHPVSFQSCKKCMLGRDWQSQKLDWFVGPLPFVSIRSQLVVTGPRESEKPFDSDFGKLDKNMERMSEDCKCERIIRTCSRLAGIWVAEKDWCECTILKAS